MKRLLLFMLVLLAASSVVLAADPPPDENSLRDFFNDVSGQVKSEGSDWVDAQFVAGQGVKTSFNSVFEAFHPSQCGNDWINTTGGPASVIGLWFVPTVFVILIVCMGIGIVYMLGEFFSNPSLIALAKDELFQVGTTLFRVLFVIGLIVSSDLFFGLSTQNSADPVYMHDTMIDGGMAFARMMVSDMMNQYSMLVLYNMVIHTIYSSTMWFGVTWRAMYSFNLGPVLKPLIDIIGTSLQFLSLGISSWLLHLVTLCIIKKWAWGLFIPIGFLLRSFPYTRNGGEALLSLTFAMVLFYPFMFLFDYEVHNVMKGNIVDSGNAMSAFINKSGILGVFGSVIMVMLLSAGVFMPFFVGGALSLAFELIRGGVYYIVIISLLLPFINIFVTLTAAKEGAEAFKVDVNFLSFLKII